MKGRAKYQDPQTPAEWQEAVDWAEFYTQVDSARKYGLITGGPEVDVRRCEQLLKRGAARGVQPSDDAIRVCLHALGIRGRTDGG